MTPNCRQRTGELQCLRATRSSIASRKRSSSCEFGLPTVYKRSSHGNAGQTINSKHLSWAPLPPIPFPQHHHEHFLSAGRSEICFTLEQMCIRSRAHNMLLTATVNAPPVRDPGSYITARHIGSPPTSFRNPWSSYQSSSIISAFRTRLNTPKDFVAVPADRLGLVQVRETDFGNST
ncbi:hypothetical protein BKA66DRAFT_468851 [Pyrenochaeta sp. MPI-SDFR-AT-0127]|nr:hypothetical protein BKA66DRAFT_468851 [Pyrenochaeta sp. MPI-SDFR-AT-0127]